MAITHADLLKDQYIFNSDRNCWMSGGGTHTWSTDPGTTHTWAFNAPIYISWLANRGTSSASNRGTSSLNQILATSTPIPLDYVAYVTLGPNTNPATPLALQTAPGATLPQNDNLFVLCSHKQLSGVASNACPLMMRWGNSIAVGQSYNAISGVAITGLEASFTSQAVWVIDTTSLGSTKLIFQCYDATNNVIWPQNIFIDSSIQATITWSSARTGRVIVMRTLP